MKWSRESLVQLLLDLTLVLAAWCLAFWLRFNLDIDLFGTPWNTIWLSGLVAVLAYAGALAWARVDRQVWRFVGLPELQRLAWGVLLGGLFSATAIFMLRIVGVPRSVLLLHPLLVLVLLAGMRAGWRTLAENRLALPQGTRPLLIVGSLQDASDALRALKGSSQWQPVGIVSPLLAELGRSLQNLSVLGMPDTLADVARATGAQTALVASPPGSEVRRQVLLQSGETGLTFLTMPRPDAWLHSERSQLRQIELDDLLGREAVQLDSAGLADLFSGQTVLVTGAGGSIGAELCRQIARFGVARLVCVDASEFAVYKLEQELRASYPHMQGLYYTANVREAQRLSALMALHAPTVVFHAAALKHVPLMEQGNEIEAVRTNVLGTLHCAQAAGRAGVRRFVLISTDKAVNPSNVMGASKRVAERVVQSVARQYPHTHFVSVRFGNVLGSSGSVVPLFSEQIARGGPVTVTHPDIVRYFMTIPEAAQLLLQAGLIGQSGHIYVLDMGQPVRIVELARMLIHLSGKTEQEVPIAYSGLRPGEKLYEELLADDETTLPTPHPKLRIAKLADTQALDLDALQQWLDSAGPAPSHDLVRDWLRSQVPEYRAADAG